MSDTEIIKRREVYKIVAKDLSLLSDDQLSTLLVSATPIGNSIGETGSGLRNCVFTLISQIEFKFL